ncbi:MAG: glycyl-radical enzyme activating protein [Prevotella sp.]|nr:glycyl-radical enzyme activating protein [Prevotella sp.]
MSYIEQNYMQHKIRVSAIQRLCLQDGPGVRTTVFLKGCYLACPWCCNPETIRYDRNFFFIKDKSLCGTSKVCQSCELYGGKNLKGECPLGAIVNTFKDYDTEELYTLLERDASIYEKGGGVTFSGGEPLAQSESILQILQLLKKEEINIAFETTLFAPRNNFLRLAPYVDYWLVDVKFQFGFITYLKHDIYKEDFARNLKDIQELNKQNVKYRMVITHQGIIKTEQIVTLFKKFNINNVELLPCHQLGINKYKQLGLKVPVYTAPTDKELEVFKHELAENQIISTSLSL